MRRPALLLVLALLVPAAVHAQSADARIRAQQQVLERIRRERSALEQRMANLQGNVHDLREEIDNLDRQREATERVLATLDRQIASIEMVVDQTSERLSTAQ
jgi:septal ring factor EnvC (AmiA/AmiB activator)